MNSNDFKEVYLNESGHVTKIFCFDCKEVYFNELGNVTKIF